ncbi:LysR family transcriptional regulator [Stutzerimonas kirkiae]|uniref:LysR family transcriptional regulator n=1 Tax=Stutzerimonas kirkiae TaxID=2211392 RepID=A0A4Q9REB3_9GAMM|nr:LysR family transcriptional regulator [Stutzerimonas kirkiae]TBU98393.1 LysR family transcriptional regulator [Stutzerimonas kirkiae]TBU98464.1 LysR family transcriptional regulator [Stutzerimonas kirkiae]TBV06938.1 LysR family transcriptional regulator [Stutzerimonas kirkiae]TBV16209.1 LysR family transcriptional regulator [Stutzerimonas kirkiae]
MTLSTESLQAFAHAAASGSFSAAGRRLGKSQSTISEAIARLEIDLGVELFVRGARQLQLTEAGRSLLPHAEEVLTAGDRLSRHAAQLSSGLETRLSLVLSDAYQPYEARLRELDERYPELEFECMIGEHSDVLDLVSQGRAQLGLLAAQGGYPPDIAHASLAVSAEFGLFVACDHPLAGYPQVTQQDLKGWRALRLSSVVASETPGGDLPGGAVRCWSAPDYLLLLEMAVQGFGWAALPRQLVAGYSGGRLCELAVAGWPKRVPVDVVWSRRRELGPASSWLLERLLAG